MEEIKTVSCKKCGVITNFPNIIDIWALKDGKEYCLKCSRKLKIGWYENKENKKLKKS